MKKLYLKILNKIFANRVSFIDYEWNLIRDNVKTKYLPRLNEFINFDNSDTGYYRVINVIHVIDTNNQYFIVCEKVEKPKIIQKK